MIQAFLVDDEEHALNILELFLERIGGVEVIGRSNNGFDAIRQLESLKPDVLFLDIEMPEMNGIELAERLRNDRSDVRIIFVTAYDQYAISAFELAAIDYILKPLEMERLVKTVARINKELDRHRGDAGLAANNAVPSLAEAPRLTIRLMGQYSAGIEGKAGIRWRTNKEKELLAYLASRNEYRAHRDQIIEDLWPEENFDKAKVYLHTSVSLLRKHLKQIDLDGIVKYENERYFLDKDQVDVDVPSFKKHLQELKQLEKPTPRDIERALLFHKGPLLKDEDYLWADYDAELLERTAAEWRLALGGFYWESGEYDKVAETAELAIERSPYDEEAYRLLMKSYNGLGKNYLVHSVYHRLTDKLEELQIKPSELTLKLYEECCK